MIKALQNIFVVLGLMAASTSFGQTTVNFSSTSNISDAMVINGSVQNSNFGNQAQMDVFHQMGQQMPMVFRTYIQYDISSIPENAIVTSATLNLYPLYINNGASHPLYIERVAYDSWSEGSITWYNQPSVINSTSDQISISHAQTTNSSVHQFDVKSHVQKMVNYPSNNNGWRIRLQNEQSSTNFGISYNSSEASNSSKRPVLSVTYILPIEMTTTVSHCSVGNDDGEFSIALSGGSTYDINDMYLYQTETTVGQIGTATISNVKTTYSLQYNSGTKTVTAKDLEPGIYIFRIFDDKYTASNDPRCIFYQHIMVGREGEVTKGILYPNNSYQDFVSISRDKPGGQNPIDRENSNYAFSNYKLDVTDSPSNYESASLMRYNIDFDDQLTFTKAEIQMKAYSQFYRDNNSSNELNLARITANWNEYSVTWNTRPNATALSAINIPTTTTIGYETSHLWDTISILPFVDYWVENPSENYGFELELDSYGNGSFADRSYKGEANNLNFIEFEFKVIVPLEYAFNDTTNLGSITVNNLESASGPYKYFIDASPIGSLMEIWNSIEDKSSYDSTSFFSGDTLGKKIVFSELYQGKYYVSIFDNNSNKIFDDSIVISPNFFFRDSSDISVNSSNEILKSVGSFSDGKLGFYRSLSDAEIYGGLVFDVVSVGEFSLGFNKFIDPTASSTTDIEFGISVDAAGNYRAIKNNYLETTILGSLISDDQIAIFRDKDEFVIAINGIENYRTHNSSLYGEELAFDAIIISATVTLKPRYYIGSFYRPRPQVNISYPECGDVFGDITVKRDRASTIGFCSLTNIEGGDPRTLVGEPYIFSDVPIGIYKLVVNYIEPGPLGGFPVVHSFLEDVAIGYVVEWEELVNTYKSELNTIALGPGAIPLSYSGSCNSTNISVTGESNWLQFETRLAPGFFGYPTMNQTLKLKNSSGTNLFSLSSSLLTGSRYLCFDLGLGVSFGPILGSPSAKWRINQDGNDFSLYKENVLQITPSGRDELFDINLSLSSTARYVRTIASFCTASQNEYIAKTKITTDGGYYLAIDKKVKFQYTGEYNISDLDYILTDAEGIEVLETDFALEKVEVPSSEEKKNADNRYIIDFESLSSGFYLLKIINAEGEEHFLRIKL